MPKKNLLVKNQQQVKLTLARFPNDAPLLKLERFFGIKQHAWNTQMTFQQQEETSEGAHCLKGWREIRRPGQTRCTSLTDAAIIMNLESNTPNKSWQLKPDRMRACGLLKCGEKRKVLRTRENRTMEHRKSTSLSYCASQAISSYILRQTTNYTISLVINSQLSFPNSRLQVGTEFILNSRFCALL